MSKGLSGAPSWSASPPEADGLYWFYGLWGTSQSRRDFLAALTLDFDPFAGEQKELLTVQWERGSAYCIGDDRPYDADQFIGLWLPISTPKAPKEGV